jgi:hypothetical protein
MHPTREMRSMGPKRQQSDELMQHALDVRLRLHIDETGIKPGESPFDAAERLLREIVTADDKLLDIRVFSWMWIPRPSAGW